MKVQLRNERPKKSIDLSYSLDRKLGSYLAASASIGAVMASDAKAIIVSNTTVQNVGINGFANIDFNSDGQIDFQIDHDRVDLTPQGGSIVDYLQIDKNDVNGASEGENLFATDFTIPFPPGATTPNDNANFAYLVQNPGSASSVEYPSALLAGAEIGVNSSFDFQEGDNVHGSTQTGRFNRLIDEDHGQADMALNGKTAAQIFTPTNSPQFIGVENQVRYLGVKMDLNNANSTNPEDPNGFTYGWIGIKITNEADATGQVVGWGYETTPGTAILAGELAPGTPGDYNGNGKVDAADYVLWRNGGPLQNETVTLGSVTPEDYTAWRASFGNPPGAGSAIGGSFSAVPEPSSLLLGLGTGLVVAGAYFWRRIRGK
jgi:PEP-CTERM motif